MNFLNFWKCLKKRLLLFPAQFFLFGQDKNQTYTGSLFYWNTNTTTRSPILWLYFSWIVCTTFAPWTLSCVHLLIVFLHQTLRLEMFVWMSDKHSYFMCFIRLVSCLVVSKVNVLKNCHETISCYCIPHTFIEKVPVNTSVAFQI